MQENVLNSPATPKQCRRYRLSGIARLTRRPDGPRINRYLIIVSLFAAVAAAQEAPESKGEAPAKKLESAATSKQPAGEKQLPEAFSPSDELSEDTSAAFPVDI